MWNPSVEMFSVIQKFFGWVVSGCLNACMSWSQKSNYFWILRGNIFLISVITIGCVTLLSALISSNILIENKPTRSKSHCLWINKITAFERKPHCGNCSCSQTRWHVTILRNEKPADAEKYIEEIKIFEQQFSSHFQVICKYRVTIDLFWIPFDINIATIRPNLK